MRLFYVVLFNPGGSVNRFKVEADSHVEVGSDRHIFYVRADGELPRSGLGVPRMVPGLDSNHWVPVADLRLGKGASMLVYDQGSVEDFR